MRSLFLLLVFSFAVQGFAATDLPSRYAFDRYAPLLRNAHFFSPPTVLDCSGKFDPRNLYIESAVHTPGGDMVKLRSTTDPSFSMTITTKKSQTLLPLKIWKTPDTSS